jgi:crotonobetainyl-CoA:carnitine CoA-transferase CaiB-like acyl-CoA transferase
MLVEVPHPVLGQVTLAGVVPRLSDTPGSIDAPGHERGADTDAVLREWLGYNDDSIAALRSSAAVS